VLLCFASCVTGLNILTRIVRPTHHTNVTWRACDIGNVITSRCENIKRALEPSWYSLPGIYFPYQHDRHVCFLSYFWQSIKMQ